MNIGEAVVGSIGCVVCEGVMCVCVSKCDMRVWLATVMSGGGNEVGTTTKIQWKDGSGLLLVCLGI